MVSGQDRILQACRHGVAQKFIKRRRVGARVGNMVLALGKAGPHGAHQIADTGRFVTRDILR